MKPACPLVCLCNLVDWLCKKQYTKACGDHMHSSTQSRHPTGLLDCSKCAKDWRGYQSDQLTAHRECPTTDLQMCGNLTHQVLKSFVLTKFCLEVHCASSISTLPLSQALSSLSLFSLPLSLSPSSPSPLPPPLCYQLLLPISMRIYVFFKV